MRRVAITLVVILAAFAHGDQVMPEWEQGTAAFREKDYSAAAALFAVVAELQQVYAPGHFMLGLSLWKLERREEAVDPLRMAVGLDADNERFVVALAQLLAEMERHPEALSVLRTVTPESLGEAEEEAYASVLAQVATASGVVEEEARRWEGRPVVLAELARALEDSVGAEEAFATYLRAGTGRSLRRAVALAMEQADEDPDTWYPRAQEAAVALTGKEPDSADGWSWLGQLLVGRGRHAEALDAFDKAREHGADAFTVGYWRGQSAAGLGRWSEALREFDAALAVAADGDRVRVESRRARALHELGRLEEAVAAYRAAGEERPAAALSAALAARDRQEGACRDLGRELGELMRDAEAAGLNPEGVRRRLLDANPECAAYLQGG